MTVAAETSRPVNPSAILGVRFLITKRIEDLDSAAARLEARQADAAERRDQLRDRLEEAEVAWSHVLKNFERFAAEDVDTQFRLVSSTRADLAALEERARDAAGRLTDMRHEQEVLRQVHRSLDDLAATAGPPAAGGGAARLRSTSRQVFQIIEEERMRIARDMHDGPAQSMANLVLQAEILERLISRDPQLVVNELADFKDGVRGVLDETRRLIFDLRPMTLDDLGLVPTLRKLTNDYDRGGLVTSLRVMGEEVRLPGALEPTLFRIIQEAMNNAKKHARAKNVEVVVAFQPHAVSAIVRDDGVGFDVAAAEARADAGKHLGMISMRERAELEKGRLEIRSQIGKGTEIRVGFEY
ncbi:MAG TPA: histidine kinase [Candidatus Binatia bacterium]|nr:histidine kinase [Candidatus Binatia bacterium]